MDELLKCSLDLKREQQEDADSDACRNMMRAIDYFEAHTILDHNDIQTLRNILRKVERHILETYEMENNDKCFDDVAFQNSHVKQGSENPEIEPTVDVDLMTHMHSSNRKAFICGICGKRCKRNSALLSHMKSHEGQTRAEIYLNDSENYDSLQESVSHTNGSCSSKEKRIITDCGDDQSNVIIATEKFAEESDYKPITQEPTSPEINNIYYEDDEEIVDSVNDNELTDRLNVEEKKDMEESDLTCKICGRKFFDAAPFERHKLVHARRKDVDCTICNRTFKYHKALESHIKKSHKDDKDSQDVKKLVRESYPCPTCGKVYAQRGSLTIHERHHTGEKPYVCSICNRGFISSARLHKHNMVHTGEKRLHCPVCDKKFAHAGNFQGHMRVHTGEKPYMCSVCGKEFRTSTSHCIHMKIHTGDRPHKCTMCDKSFITRTKLRRHMLAHSGETLFSCPTCSKGFKLAQGLQRHMRCHTGEKPYHCVACGKRFLDSSNYRAHLKRRHQQPHNILSVPRFNLDN